MYLLTINSLSRVLFTQVELEAQRTTDEKYWFFPYFLSLVGVGELDNLMRVVHMHCSTSIFITWVPND